MMIEESISINAAPETLFRIYSDVTGWKKWDPDTKDSWLDGPVQVGAVGRLVPTKGRGVPMEVTVLEPNRRFTVVSNIPLFSMTFEHELAPEGNGTRALHRVSFSGPLAFILGRMVGRQVRAGLPVTMRSLKNYAENLAGR